MLEVKLVKDLVVDVVSKHHSDSVMRQLTYEFQSFVLHAQKVSHESSALHPA